jgi:hypothetical protein
MSLGTQLPAVVEENSRYVLVAAETLRANEQLEAEAADRSAGAEEWGVSAAEELRPRPVSQAVAVD